MMYSTGTCFSLISMILTRNLFSSTGLSELQVSEKPLTMAVHDETFQLEARSFVREHAYRKVEPNLTLGVKAVITSLSVHSHSG